MPFEYIEPLLHFYTFLFIVSILVIFFTKNIIEFLDTTDLEKKKLSDEDKRNIVKKEKFLRTISFSILVLYSITFYVKLGFLNDLISSFFIIMIGYIINAYIDKKILLFYGEEVEISGNTFVKKGYKTNIFSLLSDFISFLIVFYAVLYVFEVNSLLESGGVIAGVLAFLGFTSPFWARDLVAGVIILNNSEIEAGNIIEIKEKNILAWVKNISLTEVKLIDLVTSSPIIIRNSNIREFTVINLSNGVVGKKSMILQIIDIKVDYKIDKPNLEKVVFGAYDEMISDIGPKESENKYFPDENQVKLEIAEFGDHAVHYKFSYYISSPFYIIKASRLLNTYLQKHQKLNNVYFSTPILYKRED